MNYSRQMHGFSIRHRLQPVLHSAISLYYVLLELFNAVGFPEKLSIPLGKLTAETSHGKTAVCRARHELAMSGYIIVYESKSSARAAEYVLFALDTNTLCGQKEE